MQNMKNLLVPTDFSENAATAYDYAIDIANRFGSHITLVHAYHLASTATVMVSVEDMMKEDAEAEMNALLAQLRTRLQHGASIEGKVVRGDAVGSISRLAESGGYDLIIMGSQGASGLKEIFSGSTANGVIRSVNIPVLAVPANYAFQPFSTIVFAVDEGSISSPASIKALLALGKAYNAKVRVYHKDTGEDDKGIDPSVDMFLESVEHSFHYELEADGIHDSLADFAKEYQANLLCMIRRKRSFLENIFHQSATKREVYQIQMPLLILQDDGD